MNKILNKVTQVVLICLALIFCHCKGKEQNQVEESNLQSTQETIPTEPVNYHVDTTYEYESRTGVSGNYEYEYDVSGTDSDGNEVTGTISVDGKYGSGTITNNNGETIEVEVEWVGKGELNATDENGNEYQLQVE